MDGAGPSSPGGSVRDTCSGSTPALGRFSVGVGYTSRSVRVRGVVGGGEVASYQSSRNEGNVSGIAVISGGGHRSSCACDVRQLDGCGIHQQAGRHGVPLPLLVGQSPSEMDGESRCPPRCEVSNRAVQCSGGSPQPSGSGYRDRVVSPPAGGESAFSHLGLPVTRPVCDEPQCKASPILFPPPGSPDGLRGCILPSLRQPERLRISTLSSRRKGGGSSQRDPQSLHDSGRPPLAGEGVVHRPSPSADPTTSHATLVGQAVAAVPLQPVPPQRPLAERSRVVTLQRILRKSGFSLGSAVEMFVCIRASTSRRYQVKWMLFCGWCRGKGVASVNATVPLIVDFLVHLHCDKGLSVSAVKCYRSALNSVFALKGMDLATSREISMLIRSFSKSARPEKLRPPAWGVTLILQNWTRVPYEPLQASDERFLAQKTLFLRALALAKQVGELYALSYRVSHSRD